MNTSHLIKDLKKIDQDDITSDWKWRLDGLGPIVLVSSIGDMFLLGKDNGVYWLQTGTGGLTKVADDISNFNRLLCDEAKIEEWFLPSLIDELIATGKILKDNEVYSFKVMPSLGGDYVIENIELVDISVHFLFTGQIAEQLKDLPDGTKINKVIFKKG